MSGAMTGQTIYLESKEIWKIGRSLQSDIVFQDDSISRNHCQILFLNEKWTIQDLASANGTWVNGEKIKTTPLKGNEKIQLGSAVILKFVLQDEMEVAFQKELYESATKDSLTGLYSKRYFLEQLEMDFTHHRRTRRPLSIVLLDVDHFKKVNDTHGHAGGDLVLNRLGALIMNLLRKGDTPGRIGGEELVFSLRDTPLSGARVLAERLRKMVEGHSFVFEKTRIPVTASLGVSTFVGENFRTTHELLRTADEYLYKAKNAGRNRVACYEE